MEKKNIVKDKMRKIAEIEKQVWKVYEILKKEGLGVEDSHLLLLFLSLYKDDQLEQFLDQLDEPNNIQTEDELRFGYNNRKMSYQHVRYCYKASMQLLKIKMLQKEQDKLVYGAADKQFNELALLTHTLGTPRENISACTENLIDFLSDKHEEFESLNQLFKDFCEVDIISVLKDIRSDVDFMTDIHEKQSFVLAV